MRGIIYEAALLMKELVSLHAFDGGNHRTAYIVAKTFLWNNGRRLRVSRLDKAYSFIRNIDNSTIEEIEEWIHFGEEVSEEPTR